LLHRRCGHPDRDTITDQRFFGKVVVDAGLIADSSRIGTEDDMFVGSCRARRFVARCLGWSLVALAVGLTSLGAVAVNTTTAYAAPIDCTPVGVEWIGNQLYYVENCFGYDVYRPL
jgi:hypothetical protein